jgi:regulator of sigma E protease
MDNIIKVVVTLLMLGILVIVHEWGHFIVARLFKVRVDEFSVGFGPLALKIGKRGDTEYNIRWVPLGGYVKIAGMEADEEPINVAKEKARGLLGNEPSDPNRSEIPLIAENTADKAESAEQRERDAIDGFYSKPVWQRSLIIFAGPLMSFLLALFIFCNMGWTTGIQLPSNIVGGVIKGQEAQRMGLKPSDKIIDVAGTPVHDQLSMVRAIRSKPDQDIAVTVLRNGQTLILHGKTHALPGDDGKPELKDGKRQGALGFIPGVEVKKVSFARSQQLGLTVMASVFDGMKQVFSSFRSVRENTGSVISIAAITSSAVDKGPAYVAMVAGNLTFSLAIFNLLPIPILDGGHLLIFFVESLRRGRRLTPQQQQNFMLAGLVMIGLLFIAVMTNDVLKVHNHTLPHF